MDNKVLAEKLVRIAKSISAKSTEKVRSRASINIQYDDFKNTNIWHSITKELGIDGTTTDEIELQVVGATVYK